ncbi:MAG TPA: hypothetical protein VL358_08330 [Caulobacteraceae bacterium]|jgi:hypothetical protein|nr:hypothetical protein [Caulobacteraceae bacterium]
MAARAEFCATAGTVRLIAWPDAAGLADGYARMDGACCPRWRRASRDELVANLFILYAKMVLHGMNPLGVHLALSGVAEYRDNLPPELAVGQGVRRPAAAVVRLADYRNPLPAPPFSQRV